MPGTLLVDDKVSLVKSIQEFGQSHGFQDVSYFTSLKSAKEATRHTHYQRYVADQNFEGEDGDGLAFLEEVRAENPYAEVVLLTGQAVGPRVEQRLQSIDGKLVRKHHLGTEVLERLLTPKYIGEPLAPEGEQEDVDVGELRLRYEKIVEELDNLSTLNALLVNDIVEELGALPNQEEKVMLIGARHFSPEELKTEVETRSKIGIQLIRLHHELNRRLRKGRR